MKFLFIFCFVILSLNTFAQDLNARVELLYPKLQFMSKSTLDMLEKTIKDFLNNRKWTDDILQAQERIDCSFVINLNSWDETNGFHADAQIQSSRPIYRTNYNSTILNIRDKDFNFTYSEGQPLDFSEQNYTNNLSSLLAFYAFTIVGMDYDTFSELGGTASYNRANTVLNSAQSSANMGWKAIENFRNRYWLLQNLLNREYNPIRQILYNYHRQGLDKMESNPSEAKKAILATLLQLEKIDTQQQRNVISQLFISAKVDEIVDILSTANAEEKTQAYAILSRLDPANNFKYEVLKK